jgi:hypothetical protein
VALADTIADATATALVENMRTTVAVAPACALALALSM